MILIYSRKEWDYDTQKRDWNDWSWRGAIMRQILDSVVRYKLNELRAGRTIVTNDAEMDAMVDKDSDTMKLVRSKPNPKRVGILDQYIAWIGPIDGPDVSRIEHCRENG